MQGCNSFKYFALVILRHILLFIISEKCSRQVAVYITPLSGFRLEENIVKGTCYMISQLSLSHSALPSQTDHAFHHTVIEETTFSSGCRTDTMPPYTYRHCFSSTNSSMKSTSAEGLNKTAADIREKMMETTTVVPKATSSIPNIASIQADVSPIDLLFKVNQRQSHSKSLASKNVRLPNTEMRYHQQNISSMPSHSPIGGSTLANNLRNIKNEVNKAGKMVSARYDVDNQNQEGNKMGPGGDTTQNAVEPIAKSNDPTIENHLKHLEPPNSNLIRAVMTNGSVAMTNMEVPEGSASTTTPVPTPIHQPCSPAAMASLLSQPFQNDGHIQGMRLGEKRTSSSSAAEKSKIKTLVESLQSNGNKTKIIMFLVLCVVCLPGNIVTIWLRYKSDNLRINR